MSLVWMDGFEGYGTGATNPSVQLARRYAVGDTQYFSIVAGRTGGYAVKSVNGSYYFQTPALTTNGTMIVSFGYRTDYAIQSYNICFLFDGDTQGMGLALTAGGDIQVCRGGAVLATTTGLACVTNTWYFIEFKVVCGSAGSYELRVNGNTVLSATGVNTQAGSHAYHDRVRFMGGPYCNPCTDDFYVCDGAGSVNNDFLGNNKIVGVLPDANGDASQWTGSGSGDHYTEVNENPPDDDTTYVEDATSGDKELWGYAALSNLGVIRGIQISTEARVTDVQPLTLKTVAKSAGTESADAGQVVSTTPYGTYLRLMETDHSGNPWTMASVNGTQFGVEVG